jgi:hypothetical protein
MARCTKPRKRACPASIASELEQFAKAEDVLGVVGLSIFAGIALCGLIEHLLVRILPPPIMDTTPVVEYSGRTIYVPVP